MESASPFYQLGKDQVQIEVEIVGIVARRRVLKNQILSMLLEVYSKFMVHMVVVCFKENRSSNKLYAKSLTPGKKIQQDHKCQLLLAKKSVRVVDIHKQELLAKPKIKMRN